MQYLWGLPINAHVAATHRHRHFNPIHIFTVETLEVRKEGVK